MNAVQTEEKKTLISVNNVILMVGVKNVRYINLMIHGYDCNNVIP